MFIFCYQGASKQCYHQTKTAVFLTTRHFIPNFYFKIKQNTCKRRPYYITPSITYCIENKTKRIMKGKIKKVKN